jgi:hypothetical protein
VGGEEEGEEGAGLEAGEGAGEEEVAVEEERLEQGLEAGEGGGEEEEERMEQGLEGRRPSLRLDARRHPTEVAHPPSLRPRPLHQHRMHPRQSLTMNSLYPLLRVSRGQGEVEVGDIRIWGRVLLEAGSQLW